ncbi:Retrotransposon nucleocapsid protein, related [Eimeria mitis]|uniref:Retrotransposon nucleocapsid protein, related n=1 Tax=Eimeria mitis TaxID=44415 RepID=U6JZH8_9EIME|nr:Retrotransposon nucleocapsid protein, related [Eimeria mitis]CDJ28913.1 Retrotransposon nucleocapsid protein, related [Eimeria mitis]
MLRTYIQTDERDWERLLPALELAYNTTSHSSTELSPFEIMIGQNPITAADLDVVGNLDPTLTPPMTKIFQQLCDRAQGHILKAKWQQKQYADAHRCDVRYSTGDKVWISSHHLPPLNQCPKLEPRFRGPFLVLERIGAVAYRIALPPTYSCHNVFHVSQLVPDRPRDPMMQAKEAAVGWLPVQGPDGVPTDSYEVDYILNQRGSGSDTQYLVKWRGAPEDRATWEPAEHLTNCPSILRAWRRYYKRTRGAQRDQQSVVAASDSVDPPQPPDHTPLRQEGGEVARCPSAVASPTPHDTPKPQNRPQTSASDGEAQGRIQEARILGKRGSGLRRARSTESKGRM